MTNQNCEGCKYYKVECTGSVPCDPNYLTYKSKPEQQKCEALSARDDVITDMEKRWVELAPDQTLPANPYPRMMGHMEKSGSYLIYSDYSNPDHAIYGQAQKDMLAIQPDGTAFRRVIIN